MERSGNIGFFSEFCDLKVSRYGQLTELIKIHVYVSIQG